MPLPIRITVRVDFSDGSQQEHEVRTKDALPAPGGFWPEGVVTVDVARRMEHDRRQQEEVTALRAEIDCLRAQLAGLGFSDVRP